MRKHFKLDDWQIRIKKYILENKNAAVFVEPRLGKTLAAIEAIEAYKEIIRNVVIIAPASAFDDWKNELKGIATSNVITGTKEQRIKKINNNTAKYIIINYEGYETLYKEFKIIAHDVLLFDESHKLKTPTTKRTKFFMKYNFNTKHKIIMTGTPAPENTVDYFCQLYILDKNIIGADNFYMWRLQNFTNGFHKWTIKTNKRDAFFKTLDKHCLFIDRKDYNVNPVFKTKIVYSKLPVDLMAVYKETERTYILKYGDVKKKTNYSIGAYIWQRQLASGFIDGSCVSNHKINTLLRVLKLIKSKKPVIIWAIFINELEAIYAAVKLHGSAAIVHGNIKKDEQSQIYKDFKKGKIKYLVVNPVVWKESKNLSNAFCMVYFSVPLSNETYLQSKDRCVNVRALRKQIIYYILTENTIDEIVYKKMTNKNITISFTKFLLQNIKEKFNAKKIKK